MADDILARYNTLAQQNYKPQNWQAAFAPNPKKKRSLIDSLLPAIGGGAAGLLAAPFTGGLSLAATIAAIGGASALGGGLGEFGAQKSNGEKTNFGKIAKEGAISGALGAGGEAFTGLRAAKAAGEAAGESGNLISKISAGLNAGESGGNVVRGAAERSADNLFGDATGVKAGGAGSKLVTPQRASELQNFLLDEVKIPKTANANQVLEHTTNFLDKTGKAIGDAVATGDRVATSAEKNAIIDTIKTDSRKIAGFDLAKNAEASTLLKQIGSANTLGDLNDLRQGADALQNFARSGSAKVPGLEKVAESARNAIEKLTTKEIDGLKPLQTSYSKAKQVLDLAGPAAKSPTGVSFGAFKLPGGAATQSIKAGAATAARGTDSILGLARPVAGALAEQGLPRALMGQYSSAPNDPGSADPNSTTDGGISDNGYGLAQDQSKAQLDQLNQTVDQALQQDLSSSGGKNVANILKYYDFASKNIGGSTGEGKTLTAAQQTQHDALQSAFASLSAASDNFTAGGGGKGALLGQTSKIPLVGQYLNSTGAAYERTKIDTATQLAKAISGSSRAPEAVLQQVLHSLPDTTDTPKQAQDKLNNLYRQLAAQAQAHGFDDVLRQFTS